LAGQPRPEIALVIQHSDRTSLLTYPSRFRSIETEEYLLAMTLRLWTDSLEGSMVVVKALPPLIISMNVVPPLGEYRISAL
jgi:hypothetical protein